MREALAALGTLALSLLLGYALAQVPAVVWLRVLNAAAAGYRGTF